MNRSRAVAFWTVALSLPLIALIIGVGITSYWAVRPSPVTVKIEGDPTIIYDPNIGFTPPPNAKTKRTDGWLDGAPIVSYSIFTDSRGARVSRPDIVSPTHVDVMTIGCSVAWGAGVGNENTFAAKIGAELGVTESNFAMGSYGTVQSLQMLRRNADLSPKLVIYEVIADLLRRNVSSCASSYFPFCLDVSYIAWGPDGQPQIRLPHSNGVRRVELQVASETERLDPATWLLHGIDVDYGRVLLRVSEEGAKDERLKDSGFRFLLEQMDRTVREIGAKLLVVYVPLEHDGPVPSAIVHSVTALHLQFLDLTEAFRQNAVNPSNPSAYIPNDGHPSVTGHQIIADQVVDFVRREGLLR
jgi:hypothetical protein